MKNQTLKNCITTLQALRDAHYSQLNASALAELDEILQQLINLSESSEMRKQKHDKLVDRTLRIIDIIVRLVSNISDWMQ
ncbi:hypothetical protein [Arsenophonus nasoniae]|uniref:Uncharacterized protein n=1 Tax=Arsenophonus nasoniae TaxID=638 RepID=A0AA95K291_9GAMM|nr:hypothetical protein [Arsenophonus nasoniae]WGL96676.1 hypothetical protein QE207_09170 [Arsenophonus nasoniae]